MSIGADCSLAPGARVRADTHAARAQPLPAGAAAPPREGSAAATAGSRANGRHPGAVRTFGVCRVVVTAARLRTRAADAGARAALRRAGNDVAWDDPHRLTSRFLALAGGCARGRRPLAAARAAVGDATADEGGECQPSTRAHRRPAPRSRVDRGGREGDLGGGDG